PLGLTPQGTIDPANIAIAPGVSAFREARPFLNLFRNAKTVTSTIFASQPDCPTQPSAQALATVNITPKATKSYYSYSLRGFTHYQDSQARWRGQVYNAKTGLDDPVPDGQYYYQVSAQPMGVSNISPQKLTLPVKVDSQAPTINNSQLVPGSDNQVHFKTTLADALSGLDAFGRIGLTVNGVFEIYSFHLDQSHQVTADVDLTLTKVQQETVKAGANQVRVMVYDNAGNLADVQADLSGDQVASLVAPGSPKDSDQPQTGQNKADPAKSGEPTKVDQPKVGPVGSKSPTKDNQPGSSNGSRQPGTQPVKSENDKTAAKKAEDPLVVFDHHIRLGSNTISAQNSSYNLKKQELTISGRVRSDCRQATLLIGEKDGQGQTVAIDPQSLTFTTTIPAPPNAKVSVPIRLQQDGQDKLVGGLQFYLDTTLPELSLFEEKSFERLYNGYYQIKTNQDHYKLTGQAGDNYDGYRIFINGNMVARKNFSMTFNQKNNGSVTQFAVPMALTTGDNYADIRVYDASGNFSSKTFNVRYYQADLPKPTVQRSETKPTQYPILLIPRATLPKDVPADDAVKIEYSEDQGQTWSEYQYQLSIYQNTTILFRSVDSYGNHSPVVAEKIANIKGGRAGVPAPNQPRTPTPVKPSQPTNPGHGTGNQPGSQPGQPGVVNSTTRNKHCQHGQSRLRHRVGCRHACLRIGHAIRHQLHLHNRNARRLYHQGTHLIHRINHQIRRNTRHLIHGGLGWLRRIY
ncbi:hypothetical protein, partial [Fructobacillus ficulneus]|uniref:hypothetical protein n=1 Tax=Fructobacillus ficulneus TaxID=157463 RepID=UPI000B12DC8D